MVERCPDKTEAGGSIPPMPTIDLLRLKFGQFSKTKEFLNFKILGFLYKIKFCYNVNNKKAGILINLGR